MTHSTHSGSSEVTVLGGGPAGGAASLLLTSWGHRVKLITKAGVDHRLAVSLPPSVDKLFAAIGVSDAIDRANFIRSTGNTVWWGASSRVERFASGALGWQVDVSQLAHVILQRAIAAGVLVERQLVSEVPSGLVLDCTGRSGVVARAKNVRRLDQGHRTIALVGEWQRNDQWPVPDDTHTLIESYDDGWMWSVPVGEGVRHIAAMVDPQRSGLARGGSRKDIYGAEIAKTHEFKRLTAGASLVDGPWGWDASQYDASEYAGDGWLLVGDAGSFIDPLSSAGVKKALASAWLSAVVAHTCLTSPSMTSHALSFFSDREREIATHLQRESVRFMSEAATGHSHAFWADRSEEDDAPSDRDEIRRAFERLRVADRLAVRIGSGISIAPKPIIRGRELVLEPHVLPAGIRYVSGIDLVVLLELGPSATQVPDLYDAYVKRAGSASLHDFLSALATAFARGWLVAE